MAEDSTRPPQKSRTTINAVEKIKAAAAKLNPDEQVEFFRWWIQSDGFKKRQLAALNRDVTVGIEQLESGRYTTYNDGNLMELAEKLSRTGRKRLGQNG
jgi:hypothetical protein